MAIGLSVIDSPGQNSERQARLFENVRRIAGIYSDEFSIALSIRPTEAGDFVGVTEKNFDTEYRDVVLERINSLLMQNPQALLAKFYHLPILLEEVKQVIYAYNRNDELGYDTAREDAIAWLEKRLSNLESYQSPFETVYAKYFRSIKVLDRTDMLRKLIKLEDRFPNQEMEEYILGIEKVMAKISANKEYSTQNVLMGLNIMIDAMHSKFIEGVQNTEIKESIPLAAMSFEMLEQEIIAQVYNTNTQNRNLLRDFVMNRIGKVEDLTKVDEQVGAWVEQADSINLVEGGVSVKDIRAIIEYELPLIEAVTDTLSQLTRMGMIESPVPFDKTEEVIAQITEDILINYPTFSKQEIARVVNERLSQQRRMVTSTNPAAA
jgi:hypothetical protein